MYITLRCCNEHRIWSVLNVRFTLFSHRELEFHFTGRLISFSVKAVVFSTHTFDAFFKPIIEISFRRILTGSFKHLFFIRVHAIWSKRFIEYMFSFRACLELFQTPGYTKISRPCSRIFICPSPQRQRSISNARRSSTDALLNVMQRA